MNGSVIFVCSHNSTPLSKMYKPVYQKRVGGLDGNCKRLNKHEIRPVLPQQPAGECWSGGVFWAPLLVLSLTSTANLPPCPCPPPGEGEGNSLHVPLPPCELRDSEDASQLRAQQNRRPRLLCRISLDLACCYFKSKHSDLVLGRVVQPGRHSHWTSTSREDTQ